MSDRAPGGDQIPLLDLKAQYRTIRDQVRSAVDRVLDDQVFILGKEVTSFEAAVGKYLETPHAFGVSSGSDALVVSLRALDVGPGDAVLCPTYTFFATAGAASRLGATPVFFDVEQDTLNIDLNAVQKYLESCEKREVDGRPTLFDKKRNLKVRAFVPVHLFGQPVDMTRVMALCEPHGIHVIEDVAQAIGARWKGKPVGTFGATGCYSFFPSKNLGCAGDGGLVVANDAKLAARLKRLRAHGAEPRYHHHEVGFNFRLDAIQAAILNAKLPHLESWSEGRRQVAKRYNALFTDAGLTKQRGGPVELIAEREGTLCVYHQYVIRVEAARRNDLEKHLGAAGIGTAVYYPGPLHLQPCFAPLGYKAGDLPVAERACAENVALPIYPELTEEQQRRVVAKIGEFFAKKN